MAWWSTPPVLWCPPLWLHFIDDGVQYSTTLKEFTTFSMNAVIIYFLCVHLNFYLFFFWRCSFFLISTTHDKMLCILKRSLPRFSLPPCPSLSLSLSFSGTSLVSLRTDLLWALPCGYSRAVSFLCSLMSGLWGSVRCPAFSPRLSRQLANVGSDPLIHYTSTIGK